MVMEEEGGGAYKRSRVRFTNHGLVFPRVHAIKCCFQYTVMYFALKKYMQVFNLML